MKAIELINKKIKTKESLKQLIDHWTNEKVVFTNGCFDILHRGHITYLAQAKDLGSKLIIGLNTDRSVRAQNKGKDRPINNEQDRLFQLASLSFVDAVVLFDEETPLDLILAIQPSILVKGGDYNASQLDAREKDYIVGAQEVRNKGGQVKTIPLVDGYSTTAIIQKIKS